MLWVLHLDEFEDCPGPCRLWLWVGPEQVPVSSLEAWVPCLPFLAHPLLHLCSLAFLGNVTETSCELLTHLLWMFAGIFCRNWNNVLAHLRWSMHSSDPNLWPCFTCVGCFFFFSFCRTAVYCCPFCYMGCTHQVLKGTIHSTTEHHFL